MNRRYKPVHDTSVWVFVFTLILAIVMTAKCH